MREGAGSNTALNNTALGNASWTLIGSTSGPTRTVNDSGVLAPDGTQTATKLVYPAVPAGYSLLRAQADTTSSAGKWTYSAYLFATSPTTIYISADSSTYTMVSIPANTWIRASDTRIRSSNPQTIDIGFNVPATGTTSGCTVWVWMPQMEPSAFMTSPMPSTSSAGSRAADLITVSLPANTLAVGSCSIDVTPSWSGGDPGGTYFLQLANNNTPTQTVFYEPGNNDVATFLNSQFMIAGGNFSAGVKKHYTIRWTNTTATLTNVTDGTSNSNSFASSATAGANQLYMPRCQ